MQPNYEPQQPDTTIVPAVPLKPKTHPVRQVCRCVLVVLCTILLVLTTTGILGIAAIRKNVTPEYVYTYADTLDYLHFPLPENGSFFTISELMQENFAAVGFSLTDADMELIFDQFSISTILAGFAQDVVSWLLCNGSRPVLDADEIAATALSGVDDSLLMVLYFLGDPVELVSGFLTEPLSNLDTAGMFDALEPVRFCLSQTVFDLSISVCLLLVVMLFCLSRCSVGKLCLPLGSALVGAGLVTGALRLLLPNLIPRLTVVYAEYLTTFCMPILRWLGNGALVLLLSGGVFLAIGTLVRVVRRRG